MSYNNNSPKLSNKITNAQSKISNASAQVSNTLSKAYSSVSNRVSNMKNNVTNKASNYTNKISNSTRGIREGARQFAEANSTISKVVFLIFVVILFVLLLKLGMFLLTWMLTPSKNPIVLNGMRSTNKGKIYRVNPSEQDPKPILRSINEDQGMEFTWSTWFYMEDIAYGGNSSKRRIFSKGKNSSEETDMMFMSSPGLYAHADSNKIDIVLNTYDDNATTVNSTDNIANLYETITIDNIPIKKWVNLIIRVQNNTVDVYLNGSLVERKNMDVVPKQNYGDIYVGDDYDGMNGFISSLRYFNHAIGQGKIQDIMYNGPNLKMEGDEFSKTQPPYLAMRWYFDQHST